LEKLKLRHFILMSHALERQCPMTLREKLFHEILMARKRVYEVGSPTPLEQLELDNGVEVWLKREDISPIHAYKWRGAYNRMAVLTPDERERGVVCASAGNHAQGVALAAQHLKIHATIYMPRSTPRMKQHAVRRIGGDWVDVVLTGDNFDAAKKEALAYRADSDGVFVHPYDDLLTMAGQGTLADEVVMSGKGPFDVAYVQIGGGGMASAVACWLKAVYPGIRIIGVEGVDQASMQAAIKAGAPVRLEYVDVFCDGTAVRQVGALTHELCSELLDDIITVTNDEVCAAIELFWEARRCLPEPSGAMGLAGLIKQAPEIAGQKALVILCGANVDFDQLAWISRHAGIGAARRRYYRLHMSEAPGGLRHLLNNVLGPVNIIEVQYGKVDMENAWPVIGFEASPAELALMERRLQDEGIPHQDVTSEEDVEFRIIHYEPQLFMNPYFITFEFSERAGALREFLDNMGDTANLCYFNYTSTGEQVGRALIGFEFEEIASREEFIRRLAMSENQYHETSEEVLKRVL
jgi:threonine dehydratase